MAQAHWTSYSTNLLCAVWEITSKNLGSLVTYQNSVQDEVKYKLKAGNLCYYSVQTILSSRLLSKNLKIKVYKTIILPVVLFGCEAWSLTLREERRLRGIWKQDPEANIWAQEGCEGEWRRFHNEELHNLYRSPNILRVIKLRWLRSAGYIAKMDDRSAFKMLTGSPTGKIPLGRPKRNWEDNIRMDLKGTGYQYEELGWFVSG